MIDIDRLLEEVGEFGKYQKLNIFYLGLSLLFTASSTMAFVFTTGDMNYRFFCFVSKIVSPSSLALSENVQYFFNFPLIRYVINTQL